MGGSSSPPATTTSVTKSEPWEGQKEPLKFAYEEAQRLYDLPGPSYYPGETFVGPSAETEAGLAGIMGRASAGNPLVPQAQTELGNVIAGNYLDPTTNPVMQNIANVITGDVRRATDSQFGMANRAGSGAHAESLGRGISSGLAQLYGGAYGDERNRMMSATGMVPALTAADYTDFDRMLGVGATREGYDAAKLQDLIARYTYDENLPQSKLGTFLAQVGGPGYGTSSTTGTTPVSKGNPLMGALGGAAGAAGIGTALSLSNPYMIPLVLAGAGAGLLG